MRSEPTNIDFVLDYWDVPIEGIASSSEGSYYFRAIFDVERDQYSDVYEITAISETSKRLTVEAKQCWTEALARDTAARENWQAELKGLTESIARDRQQNPPRRVTACFFRVSEKHDIQHAFRVVWKTD